MFGIRDLSILVYIVFIDFLKSAAKIQKKYEYLAEYEKKEVLLQFKQKFNTQWSEQKRL